jgi:hypothetical protein
VSASLKSAEAEAEAEADDAELDGIPELPWFMPDMLLVSELPVPDPAEQPARAMAAAMAAAEIVRVFFMKSGPQKYQRRRFLRLGIACSGPTLGRPVLCVPM